MTTLSSDEKDLVFRHPRTGPRHFGRHLHIASDGSASWSVVQVGEGKHTRVLLLRRDSSGALRSFLGPAGLVHRPIVEVSDAGDVVVLWNEATVRGWEIRAARVDAVHGLGQHDVVFASSGLCLPPCAAFQGGTLHVAWSAIQADNVRVMATSGEVGQWRRPSAISSSGVDAFRPALAAGGGQVVLAWDQYRDRRYEVAVARASGDAWTQACVLRHPTERWLDPRLVVNGDGVAFVAWVALKAVTNKLGVIDHWPMGMVARVDTGSVTPLLDEGSRSDERIVADLRDGLLASSIYKGYVGLRRNPRLSLDARGAVWCFWESRGESEDSVVRGSLLARRLRHDGIWERPLRVLDSGYCYAVPASFGGDQIPVAHLSFEERDLAVVQTVVAELGQGKPCAFEESRWRHWVAAPVVPEAPPAHEILTDTDRFRFYWADTHVHSVFSPDAEGELDELAHFARDEAGLQIITVIDNDFYPHKALTEPEWRIHQALAGHFTEEGRFIWMPGYEFTYHRGDLAPDFNHRCVIFPSGHGDLRRRIDADSNTDAKLIDHLRGSEAIVYPHHPTYALLDNSFETNVEVTSSWRVCIEETAFTIQQLKSGCRLGFIGSSDTHRAVPGLGGARTGVLARALTRADILNAYRQRRLVATQGHNVAIDFRVNGAVVGSCIETRAAPAIAAVVYAPTSIDYVEIIRDGEPIFLTFPNAGECTLQHVDESVDSGVHFYFLRVKLVGDPSFNRDGRDPARADPRPFSQDSRYPHNLARARGPFAWSSPIWVERGESPRAGMDGAIEPHVTGR